MSFRSRIVDPQVAVLAINKLFGGTGEEPDPKAPRVDADLSIAEPAGARHGQPGRADSRSVAQAGRNGRRRRRHRHRKQHVRLLPLSGAAARSAITQIEQIWPSVRPNRIRIVTPTAAIPDLSAQRIGRRPTVERRQQVPPAATRCGRLSELQELWQMLRSNDSPKPAAPAAAADQALCSSRESDRRHGVAKNPASSDSLPARPLRRPAQPAAPTCKRSGPVRDAQQPPEPAARRSSSHPARAARSSPPTTWKRSTSSKNCSRPWPAAMPRPAASTPSFI